MHAPEGRLNQCEMSSPAHEPEEVHTVAGGSSPESAFLFILGTNLTTCGKTAVSSALRSSGAHSCHITWVGSYRSASLISATSSYARTRPVIRW